MHRRALDADNRAKAIQGYTEEIEAEAMRIRRTDGEMGDVGYLQRRTEEALGLAQSLVDDLRAMREDLEGENSGE